MEKNSEINMRKTEEIYDAAPNEQSCKNFDTTNVKEV